MPIGFAVVMELGMLGLTAVGTLFAALVSSTKLQGGLLAMVVFPIILPLVIVSTQLPTAMFRDGHGPDDSSVAMLVAFDVVFLMASWLLFELVLEP